VTHTDKLRGRRGKIKIDKTTTLGRRGIGFSRGKMTHGGFFLALSECQLKITMQVRCWKKRDNREQGCGLSVHERRERRDV